MKQLSQQDIQRLMMMYQQGQHDSVIEVAEKLILDFPKEFILFNILGVSYEKKGDLEKASIAYKKALKINPSIPELQFNLGAILHAQNQYQESIKYYQKAISLKADFVEAYFNLGVTYQSLGEFVKATSAYEQALKIQPGFYEALTNLGTIKQMQGDLNEAIKCFQQSLAIFDDARGH